VISTIADLLFCAKAQKGTTMNTVNLIGRLTKDPELRRTEDGRAICNFNLAIDDTYSKEDRADFIRITVFGTQAENCEKYLRKGLLTGVNGRIRSESYTDADGIKRYPVTVTADRVQFCQFPEREVSKDEPERNLG
jgi:single-strand DNA-binding protein